MDRTKDAPGANDDGSGCAAVIECARIMSKHSFPATIIFVTVSGEEQGLLGSTLMANKAKKENWNIEAVLNNDIMGSNNSSETDITNNAQVRVFSEGLPAYELDSNAKRIRQFGLENDGEARQLARYIKEIGERYVKFTGDTRVSKRSFSAGWGSHTLCGKWLYSRSHYRNE
jgi:Zn-dependent M28 family amino/carboxypeptidase